MDSSIFFCTGSTYTGLPILIISLLTKYHFHKIGWLQQLQRKTSLNQISKYVLTGNFQFHIL
jgi:hypothetical protein